MYAYRIRQERTAHAHAVSIIAEAFGKMVVGLQNCSTDITRLLVLYQDKDENGSETKTKKNSWVLNPKLQAALSAYNRLLY